MFRKVASLDSFIQKISTEPVLTAALMRTHLSEDLASEIGTKSFNKALISLSHNYRARGQLGRLRACIFAGTVLLGKKGGAATVLAGVPTRLTRCRSASPNSSRRRCFALNGCGNRSRQRRDAGRFRRRQSGPHPSGFKRRQAGVQDFLRKRTIIDRARDDHCADQRCVRADGLLSSCRFRFARNQLRQ